jgi:hypothetical protein
MSNYKGISRTLLDDFNDIQDSGNLNLNDKSKVKQEEKSSEDDNSRSVTPKRDYETRNRQRTQSSGVGNQASSKPTLKPRQENSLGELTKKFIQLIKQTEDYCIDLNDAVAELNVQK